MTRCENCLCDVCEHDSEILKIGSKNILLCKDCAKKEQENGIKNKD